MKQRNCFVIGIVVLYIFIESNLSMVGNAKECKAESIVNNIPISKSQNLSFSNPENNNDPSVLIYNETYLPIIGNRFRFNHLLAFLYSDDIWVVNEDGSNKKQLSNIGNVTGYSWSPNGEQIALIVSNLSGVSDIYLINDDGSNLSRLTIRAKAFRWVIDWSGSKVALLRDIGKSYVKISYIELNNPNHPIVDISPALINYGMGLDPIIGAGLRWSPDGKWIVLNHGSAKGIASVDGSIF